MTDKEQIIAIIQEVVNNNHWVKDRIAKLKEKGFTVSDEWVGSGGIGTIRTIRGNECIQISAAVGGNNFVGKAYVVWLN